MIFSIIFLFSNSFISIHLCYFFLCANFVLSLFFFYNSQGVKLNCDLRSFFSRGRRLSYKFLLRTAYVAISKFWHVECLFPFSLASAYDFISLLIISLTYWFFRNVLFNCHIFVGISLLWLKVSYYFCQKAYLKQIQYY